MDAEAAHAGHAHAGHGHAGPGPGPGAEARLPPVAWGLVAVVAAIVAGSWVVTWWTAERYDQLMMAQLAGAAPTDVAMFVALSGVMMVAMMLPSALPMVAMYRGLAAADAGAREARLRTWVFTAGYFVVWTAFTALSVVALMAFGLMGAHGGPVGLYGPGALLVAAGVYQLTGWKQFCLRHCRTPLGFVTAHWRGGRRGAARMGVEHGLYCLGCCWLLMLVLFTAGAMSVLWMGVFAGLVLGEKVLARGDGFAKAMGVAGIAVGALALGAAWTAPPPAMDPGMPGDGGMGMGGMGMGGMGMGGM